jgi:hypothetical protein
MESGKITQVQQIEGGEKTAAGSAS